MTSLILILIFAIGSGIIGLSVYFLSRKPALSVSRISERYANLISLLKNESPVMTPRVSSRSVSFKLKRNKDLHAYSMTEVDGRIIVVWTLESSVHGRRGKEWSFNSDYPQEKMFSEIHADILNYEKNLHRN